LLIVPPLLVLGLQVGVGPLVAGLVSFLLVAVGPLRLSKRRTLRPNETLHTLSIQLKKPLEKILKVT
jgi:hypothetical protein